MMSFLALLMGAIITGTTVIEYGNQPLDMVQMDKYEAQEEKPFLEGKVTWYDYELNGKLWSRTHDTCALRIKKRYGYYKVCSKATGKCVRCYHNDYGPAEYTNKVIDLSSHAFKELGIPLSRGVADVVIYKSE